MIFKHFQPESVLFTNERYMIFGDYTFCFYVIVVFSGKEEEDRRGCGGEEGSGCQS